MLRPDLYPGKLTRFLVGFANTGEKEFVVESIGASFRYPQDYSYFIQNVRGARARRHAGAICSLVPLSSSGHGRVFDCYSHRPRFDSQPRHLHAHQATLM